jgi:hypothetical protein
VRLFTEDPNFGPDFIRYKAKTVRIFSEWLHLVANLEITKEEQRTKMAAPYLFQVWTRSGICVYEFPLQRPPLCWNLFGENFSFMVEEGIVNVL